MHTTSGDEAGHAMAMAIGGTCSIWGSAMAIGGHGAEGEIAASPASTIFLFGCESQREKERAGEAGEARARSLPPSRHRNPRQRDRTQPPRSLCPVL